MIKVIPQQTKCINLLYEQNPKSIGLVLSGGGSARTFGIAINKFKHRKV